MRPTCLASLASLILASTAVLPAQDPSQNQIKLGPRSFFPREYTGEVYVNMDALLDTDLWEEVERSLICKPMLMAFRMDFGFRLTELKTIRIGMVPHKVTYAGGYETYRKLAVTVFTGQRKLELPKPRKHEGDYNRRTNDKIGGHQVVQEGVDTDETDWSQPMLWVKPKPDCLVYGDKVLMEPVLEGRRRGGVPHPELMAVTAGRNTLAYYAIKLRYDEKFLRSAGPFPFEWYTEEDKPTFLTLRVTLDEKTQSTQACMQLRFTDGSKGPARFEEEVKASFEKMDTHEFFKRMPVLKKFTKKLAFKKSGTDLEISCDLGEAKQAIELSALAQMAPMLWFAAGAVVPVPAPAAVGVVEQAAKPKAKAKK